LGDFLVYVGGISKSLMAMGFLMSGIFTYRLFVASIMSKLFIFILLDSIYTFGTKKKSKPSSSKLNQVCNNGFFKPNDKSEDVTQHEK